MIVAPAVKGMAQEPGARETAAPTLLSLCTSQTFMTVLIMVLAYTYVRILAVACLHASHVSVPAAGDNTLSRSYLCLRYLLSPCSYFPLDVNG